MKPQPAPLPCARRARSPKRTSCGVRLNGSERRGTRPTRPYRSANGHAGSTVALNCFVGPRGRRVSGLPGALASRLQAEIDARL